jgi:ribosomal protein S18 acetylase RimI-like enzyme
MNDQPNPAFQVRIATPADAGQIAQLFFDAVHHVNSRDYAPHQIAAWAPTVRPAADWADRQNTRRTWVAVIGESIVGFGELEASGHIDCFYCHRDHQGVGVGTALLAAIVAAAVRLGVPKLFAEVSITARPFFERRGFRVVRELQTEVRGVTLVNYLMERFI